MTGLLPKSEIPVRSDQRQNPMPKPDGPAKFKIDPVNEDFTKVHNEIIRTEKLTALEKGVFLQCLYAASNPKMIRSKSWNGFAQAAGIPPRTFLRHRQKFLDIGLFRWVGPSLLQITTSFYEDDDYEEIEEFDIEVVEAEEKEEEPEKSFVERVDAAPRRAKQMSTADRWNLITEAWDKYKQEDWPNVHRSAGTKMAIELVMRNIGLNHDDYDDYIGAVIQGAKSDDFWMDPSRPKKLSFFFGSKGDLSDNQITSRVALYNRGKEIFAKELPFYARFNWRNDDVVLEAFNKARYTAWKGTPLENLPEFKKIMRLVGTSCKTSVQQFANMHWKHCLYYDKPRSEMRTAEVWRVDNSEAAMMDNRLNEPDLFDAKVLDKCKEKGTVILYYTNKEQSVPVSWIGKQFTHRSLDQYEDEALNYKFFPEV